MNREFLKENRIHGDVMYPIRIYSIDCSPSDTIDCHWHDEMEFLVVTKGKAAFQIDTKTYEVSAGEGIFVHSGELHAVYSRENSNYSFNAIVFSIDLLNSSNYDILQDKYINPIIKKQYIMPCHIKGTLKWEEEILQLLDNIVKLNKEESFTYELVTKSLLFLVISKIFLNYSNEDSEKSYFENNYKVERLKKVMNYIRLNYDKKITLKELSGLINMSESHFCRFFKQLVMKTPYEYINYIRIHKAAGLLEKSDKKIFEIAMDSGFENFSYFIMIFKKYMGCTPSKYRKLHSSGL